MIAISDEIKQLIKTVANSFPSLTKPTPTNYTAGDSGFITYHDDTLGETTRSVFIFGVSDYGGQDIVVAAKTTRANNRYYLEMRS